MRHRTLVAGLITSVALIALAAPASAGGWWSYVQMDKRHVTVGDTLRSRSEVMFQTTEAAEQAKSEPYFAYLVQGVDQDLLDHAMGIPQPQRWWAQPDTAIRAGSVRWGMSDSNITVAIVDVTIPDVPPGRYALMLCDAGCRKPLADVVPTEGISVHATKSAATAAENAADLRELVHASSSMDESLAADIDLVRQESQRGVQRAREDAQEAVAAAARAEEGMRRLDAQLAALSSGEPASPWPTAGWIAAAVVALLWAVVTLDRRRRTEPPSTPAPDVAVDDEWEYAGRR